MQYVHGVLGTKSMCTNIGVLTFVFWIWILKFGHPRTNLDLDPHGMWWFVRCGAGCHIYSIHQSFQWPPSWSDQRPPHGQCKYCKFNLHYLLGYHDRWLYTCTIYKIYLSGVFSVYTYSFSLFSLKTKNSRNPGGLLSVQNMLVANLFFFLSGKKIKSIDQKTIARLTKILWRRILIILDHYSWGK